MVGMSQDFIDRTAGLLPRVWDSLLKDRTKLAYRRQVFHRNKYNIKL
jgi:hypothetical protein